MDSPEHEIHGTDDRDCICKHVLENKSSVQGTVHSSFGSYIYEEFKDIRNGDSIAVMGKYIRLIMKSAPAR